MKQVFIFRVIAALCGMVLASGLWAQELIDMEFKGTRSQESLVLQYGVFMQNGVDLWKVTYTTPDVFGQLDTASGLLVLPLREETTIYPLAVYQHGTVDGPTDVPSNLRGGYELGVVLGGVGFATIAPDYLGAGEARGFHPYVHAATEASAAVDMIRAVRGHAPQINLLLNDQLFITGYSQGGHASMALHQVLEEELSDEMTLTAASHLSGPYSISWIMREVMISDDPYNFVAYLPNTFLSYNYIDNFYSDLEQVFKPQYVNAIQSFRDGDLGLFNLNSFLINALTQEHGAPIARELLQDSIVEVLSDPEGDHPMLEALRENDTHNFAPQAPTRIYYCTADDQVSFRNSIVADSIMQAFGAVDLVTEDLDPTADHGGCVEPAVTSTIIFFLGFADWTVNTGEVEAELGLEVFPSPAASWLQINGLRQKATAQFISTDGRVVQAFALPAHDIRLALPSMPTGVYWLKVVAEDGRQYLRKLMIR